MEEKQVIERIKSICLSRQWSAYRLAKESGITYSTLCTMLNKSNSPSIPTLMKICNGFGISLSDFFDDSKEHLCLTEEEIAHLRQWSQLTPENQTMARSYMEYLLSVQESNDP